MATTSGGAKSPGELRKFGLTLGIAFLAFGALSLWRGHTTAPAVLGTIGGLLLAGGLIVPTALGPVERAWMGLAHLLSKVTTPIFLGIVYFVVFTPAGLIRRIVGRHPLEHDAVNDSFWHDRGESPRGDLERQF
jgi:hypothetical protein